MLHRGKPIKSFAPSPADGLKTGISSLLGLCTFEKVKRKWKDVAAAGLSFKRYPFGYLWQILARHGSKTCLEIPRFI